MKDYTKIVAEMKKEFPQFQIVQKNDSTLMQVLDTFIKVITFWKMKTFMTHFTTTIGYKVYIPSSWENVDKIGILKHERVHMRQMRYHGYIWFCLSYLLLWFPIGLAYFRKKYEQEAYKETMKHNALLRGIEYIENEQYKEQMIRRFTSAEYVWTWPFRKSIEEWYDGTVKTIRLEMGLPLKNCSV
jgi:hypothetical protein